MKQAAKKEFYEAIHEGNLATVKKLYLELTDLPLTDGISSILHTAAHSGSLPMVQYFHSLGCPVNYAPMPGEFTVLNSAIGSSRNKHGQYYEICKYLLENGADPNLARPMISAINHENSESALKFVRLLVEHGADVNAVYDSFRDQNKMFTALDWAGAHPNVMEYLKSKGAKPASDIVGMNRAMFKHVPVVEGDSVVEFCSREFGTPQPHALIEIVPDELPIAIHVVESNDDRKHITLFTTGMAVEPLVVPTGGEDFRYAELFIQLPERWAYRELKNRRWTWPVEWLRKLAKIPHDNGHWLGLTAIFDNGSPPEPLAPNVKFDSILVMAEKEFTDPEKGLVHLYRLFPLYPEERQLAARKGVGVLMKALDRNSVRFVVDPKRKNVAQ